MGMGTVTATEDSLIRNVALRILNRVEKMITNSPISRYTICYDQFQKYKKRFQTKQGVRQRL